MNNPDFQFFLLPLLEALRDGEMHSSAYLEDELSMYVDYSDDRYNFFIGGNSNPAFMNALSLANHHLMRAGLVESPLDHQCRITALGKMVLSKRLNSLDTAYLERMPGYN